MLEGEDNIVLVHYLNARAVGNRARQVISNPAQAWARCRFKLQAVALLLYVRSFQLPVTLGCQCFPNSISWCAGTL